MKNRRVNNRIALIVAILISIAAAPQLLNGISLRFYGNFFYGLGKIAGAIVIPGYFYRRALKPKKVNVE